MEKNDNFIYKMFFFYWGDNDYNASFSLFKRNWIDINDPEIIIKNNNTKMRLK